MDSAPITSFVGVYNADAGLAGEVRYVLAKLSGNGSCALCDITHGFAIRGKAAWRDCTATFTVPIRVFHRNDQPTSVAAVTNGRLPCVVAEHADGRVVVAVTAEQLLACKNDVDALQALLTGYLEQGEATNKSR